MHELLASLFADPATSVPAPTDNGLKIAVITAISVVLAAAITAVATTLQRRREDTSEVTSQDFITELLRRAEVAETRSASLEARNESLTSRVDELENHCWRHGVDPNTGNLVRHVGRHDSVNGGDGNHGATPHG